MKVYFNGFFPDFTTDNAGCQPSFFLDLFHKVYDEECYTGETIEESDILCEYDQLMDGVHARAQPSAVSAKKCRHTYLFAG